MDKNNNIFDRLDRHDGMTVPPGYFDDFAKKMLESLPQRPEAEIEQPRRPLTLWGRVRPYVYMAAMFAGIWCMLKMFTLMAPGNVDFNVENNQVLSSALSDENFVYDYIKDDINDKELYEEMWDDSISVDDMLPAGMIDDAGTSDYTNEQTEEI